MAESIETVVAAPADSQFSAGQKRLIKDKLARFGVTFGGVLVLVTLLLIFFYLLYVVQPIFESAKIHQQVSYALPGQGKTLVLGSEEQNEIGYRVTDREMVFFAASDNSDKAPGSIIQRYSLPEGITSYAHAHPPLDIALLGLEQGTVLAVKPEFKVSYPVGTERVITPGLRFPLGEQPLLIDARGAPLTQISFGYGDDSVVIAALTGDGRLLVHRREAEENFITGEKEWTGDTAEITNLPAAVNELLMSQNRRDLFVRMGNQLAIIDVTNLDELPVKQTLAINAAGADVVGMSMLSGANSLIVSNDNGVITQWFEVAGEGQRQLTHIREFEAAGAPQQVVPEFYRKGFITAESGGHIGIYHATGGKRLLSEKVADVTALAITPRANGLLVQSGDKLAFYEVDNEHPEVTWSALWQKVWYENYPEPQYVWQSTSASDDFEAKLSLVPISFGTFKAAFYAMLFAVPLAIAGAIYTAYFMAPEVRKVVKPTVEIMEALPTVILGFLAGLWLAPLVEENLPALIVLLLALPLGMLLTAYGWSRLPQRLRLWMPEGWDALILVPVILVIGYVAFALNPTLELWWFGGDTRAYLTNELGIGFDQRNSLVVGIAMGFAVIPTIFSIAEDAVFSVPRHLTNGSLALGATSWQTLVRVVLLTASPGIFSAVMMGLGRAVGETMIVLMATGNTPVMDFSIFQGMRTLAANIAVEMPESEVGSSHYRVLFLAAFVLFLFTFVFNTVAEFVRQRLRDKYSSL